MKKVLLFSMGVLLLIFMSVNAQAYTYQQLPLSTSSAGLPSSPAYSFYPQRQVFDDFTLTSAYSITGITWWGFYNPSSTNPAFTVRIYDDVSQLELLESGSYTGLSFGSVTVGDPTVQTGAGIKEYSITLTTPFNAAVNTTYWLSIYNAAPNSYWSWQKADALGDGAYQTNKGSVGNVAFQLTAPDAPVPIPSAAWLLGAGLIGLVVIRRRLKNKTSR